jgi:hypothetical protein
MKEGPKRRSWETEKAARKRVEWMLVASRRGVRRIFWGISGRRVKRRVGGKFRT